MYIYVKFQHIIWLGGLANSCNPATGESENGMAWGGDHWSFHDHVDPVSALRSASTWSPGGNPGRSGCY